MDVYVNAKSFGYITGMNNSFNAIKVFKTKVTRSQRKGKGNAKIIYCLLKNLKLEE